MNLHFNRTIKVFRMVTEDNLSQYGETPVVAGIKCALEVSGSPEQYEAVFGNLAYKRWRMFTYFNVDIRETDKIVAENGDAFIVQGVSPFHQQHKEFALVKE